MKRTILLETAYTLDEIAAAAAGFWRCVQAYRIIAFSGEMGAGKTTFIHHLCEYLGVEDVVSSPTFALINEYHYTGAGGRDEMIYHMDWYRLKDEAEAINAGMEDCLITARKGSARCFIEWPAKAAALLQPPFIWVSIAATSPYHRLMTVEVVEP
jgi:tRNA threonylcarbamoyladenosine biosynthesis protein TsaE